MLYSSALLTVVYDRTYVVDSLRAIEQKQTRGCLHRGHRPIACHVVVSIRLGACGSGPGEDKALIKDSVDCTKSRTFDRWQLLMTFPRFAVGDSDLR